jgi:hypothetical protein
MRRATACLWAGFGASVLAVLLATAAYTLPARIEASVMAGIRDQIVWQPDSPQAVAGGRAPAHHDGWGALAEAPSANCAAHAFLPSLQRGFKVNLTHPCRQCTPPSGSLTSQTWQRCGWAPNLCW